MHNNIRINQEWALNMNSTPKTKTEHANRKKWKLILSTILKVVGKTAWWELWGSWNETLLQARRSQSNKYIVFFGFRLRE